MIRRRRHIDRRQILLRFLIRWNSRTTDVTAATAATTVCAGSPGDDAATHQGRQSPHQRSPPLVVHGVCIISTWFNRRPGPGGGRGFVRGERDTGGSTVGGDDVRYPHDESRPRPPPHGRPRVPERESGWNLRARGGLGIDVDVFETHVPKRSDEVKTTCSRALYLKPHGPVRGKSGLSV